MSMKRIIIKKELLRKLFSDDDPVTYEMALQSYLHSNPLVGWIVAWRMNIALDLVGPIQGRSLLDYGCGLGVLLLQFPERSAILFGTDLHVDPAEKVLAGHGRDDVTLFTVSEYDHHIQDNSLDVIVSLEVLEHVDDLMSTVQLLYRSLKPGGRLVVSGPSENKFYGILRKIAGFTGEYHHRNIYDIVDQICKQGFKVNRKKTIPLLAPLDVFAIYEFVKTI